jgi:hypothetical protein
MFALAGRKPAGISRSLSHDAAVAGAARAQAAISRAAETSKRELQSRTLQALQSEGYAGRGELTVLSDGAEIMKRLPKALPQPTAHIIDWFHIAMKIQPLQQIADHVVRALPQTACSKGGGIGNIRARRSSALARPYIARLRTLRRLIWPSV